MVDSRKGQQAETCVLYLRMSDERQEHSIPAQRQELLRYAEKHGYKVLREYLDEAISGDDTRRRVGFLRMREDAQQGEFSVVLCWDQDRFGRFDPIEGGHWILPFRDAGVRLETIAQGKIDWNDFAGRLIYLVQQEGKHAYLRDLSRNVTRGLLASANTRRVGTGGTSPQGLRNDPERAAIVRRMFLEYLKPRASLRSVAELLNCEGVLSPRGKFWTVTTVRQVLTNRKYTGAFVRFRYRAGKYHAVQDGEIVSRLKSSRLETAEPMVVENHHEAVVDQKSFDAVQAKLLRQRRATAHRTGRQYLLSGLLVCADCGQVMAGAPYHRGAPGAKAYRCHRYQDGGSSACFRNQVKEETILDVVLARLQAAVFSEAVVEKLLALYRKRLAERRECAPVDDGRLRKRLDEISRQIDQGTDRVLSAPDNLVSTIYAKLDKLRVERDRLQAQLNATGQVETGSNTLDEQKVEEAARVLRDMREAFQDAEPAEVQEMLRQIVSKVELSFEHRRQGKRMKNELCGGGIFLRPGLLSTSIMQSILGSCEQDGCFVLRFTAKDLRRAA